MKSVFSTAPLSVVEGCSATSSVLSMTTMSISKESEEGDFSSFSVLHAPLSDSTSADSVADITSRYTSSNSVDLS